MTKTGTSTDGARKSSAPRAAQVRYLRAQDLQVERTEGGFLSLRVGARKQYPRVHLYWCFPLSQNNRFVSVRDREDEEIGIIEKLDEFSPETLQLLLDELSSRYFTPTIGNIHSLKEEFGYTYWDADTSAGRCRFTVQLGRNAVISLESGRLLIHDVDGNRYELEDYRTMDAKHLRVVENLL